MPLERFGDVTLNGNPLTLLGPKIKVGDQAPNFKVLANDLSEITLATDAEKVRLILSVGSLYTSVCDAEAKKFSQAATDFPDDVVVYVVSCDLPFAQGTWCSAANIANLKTLSDHRSVNFGDAYGTHVKESRMLSRAVFLVDRNDTVRYVEYVPDIVQHPNYEAVVKAVQEVA